MVSGYQGIRGVVGVELAERIREDYRRGLSTRDLAKKYRMSLRDIGKILRNEGYAVIPKKELDELKEAAELWDEFIKVLREDKQLEREFVKLLKQNEQLKKLLARAVKNRHLT